MVDLYEYVSTLAAYDLAPPVELFVLPHQGNSTQNIGVRTGSGEFVLRTYVVDSEAKKIRHEHRLLRWLAERTLSFVVPVPMPTRNGDTLVPVPHGWQSMSMRLPGARLNWHEPEQVSVFGAALGELHMALSQYPNMLHPDNDPLNELQGAHTWISQPIPLALEQLRLPKTSAADQLLDWWQEELAHLLNFVEGTYRTLPWQMIHNDFIPNNILFQEGHVTAVLDFEFTQFDVRVFDVAISLRNMLRIWENAEPWKTVQQFCVGYGRQIRLSEGEVEAIPLLMRLRNAWRVLKLMRRARVGGDLHLELQQIEHAWQFVRWLAVHEGQLAHTIQSVSFDVADVSSVAQ